MSDRQLLVDASDESYSVDLSGLVYEQLRRIAARHMARESSGHPLRPSDLVHEAYLRLSLGGAPSAVDRAHFFRLASRAMRQILVDTARRRAAAKPGGGRRPVTLREDVMSDERGALDLLELHDALRALGRMDRRLEQLVQMRFFTGLTLEESADALGVSRRKAARDWAVARLWLQRELSPG